MSKESWRRSLKDIRGSISSARRTDASQRLLETFSEPPSKKTLSFISFGSEINTGPLNAFLISTGCLYVPRVNGLDLEIYHLTHFEHLQRSKLGVLEPNPLFHRLAETKELELILVPGLGFDSSGHRIGYGGGFYDRFLNQVPKIPSVGIGFLEQAVAGALPVSTEDACLNQVSLF